MMVRRNVPSHTCRPHTYWPHLGRGTLLAIYVDGRLDQRGIRSFAFTHRAVARFHLGVPWTDPRNRGL